MKKRGLKFKLVTGGILAVLAPLITIGTFAAYKTSGALLNAGTSEARLVARNLAAMTDLLLRKEIDFTKALASAPLPAEVAASVHERGTEKSRELLEALDRYLTDFHQQVQSGYESFFVTDARGTLLSMSGKRNHFQRNVTAGDRDYFKAAQKGVSNIGNPVKSKTTGKPVVVTAVPLFTKSGEFAGMVGSVLRLDLLSQRVTEVKIGNTGYPYMVDRNGIAVVHPDNALILKTNFNNVEGMEAFTAGITAGGSGVDEYTFQGVRKLAGFAEVPATGWTVVVTQNRDELTAVARAVGNLILIAAILFILLTVPVLLRFTDSLFSPIKKLVDVLEAYGKGDTEVRAIVDTDDEIGYFAGRFNAMLEQINESAGNLRHSESMYRSLFDRLRESIEIKDYAFRFPTEPGRERLISSLNKMLVTLETAETEAENRNWLRGGQTELSSTLSGERELTELCRRAVTFIATYVGAKVGTFYVRLHEQEEFVLSANYAFMERKGFVNRFKPGEGLAGQAALEKQRILFSEVPEDYMSVSSSLGSTAPTNILVIPLVHEEHVTGVMELGSTRPFTELELDFMELAAGILSVALNTAMFNKRLEKLLERTQRQSLELKEQQEELKATNTELEAQTAVLRESESKLQLQQEELRVSNEELEEQTELLAGQKAEISLKNDSLERKQVEIEAKAAQLELAGRYKSEFLANMSHELRTPLNSLLILANMLADNSEQNLTDDQVESAVSIHRSGQNLLRLINDILDLSKIEANRIELDVSPVKIENLGADFRAEFEHMAREKGIDFSIEIDPALPDFITTDGHRLNQVVRNLLGNAVKFTDSGHVSLRVSRPRGNATFSSGKPVPNASVAFTVTDTGPGIPEDQLPLIFDAFKQVDGSISRRHGGTGLGLSISRELAALLGGELTVSSAPDRGAVFTLYIPETLEVPGEEEKPASTPTAGPGAGQLSPARTENGTLRPAQEPPENPRTILIIEDDAEFAALLSDFFSRHHYESVVMPNGERGIEYILEQRPAAVILDIGLPGVDGWAVLNELKNNPATRHIPVHIMSAYDNNRLGLERGAVGYLTKPVGTKDLRKALDRIEEVLTGEVKKLLIVEDDRELKNNLSKLMETRDIHCMTAGTGREALSLLTENRFDCMILDLGLPDITGFEFLDSIQTDSRLNRIPVIVYTGRDLTLEETRRLEAYASSIILKSAASIERLLDETALFMHRLEKNMPENQQKMLRDLRERDSSLPGKTVMVVDDDMRNAFAMGKFLRSRGMETVIADNGKKSLELLENGEKPDIILMDIMMPVMDGHEAIRRIRQEKRFKDLPILALTAKAMESDREKCIESGANDYLTKPVDTAKLLSMLRVWLYA